MLKRIKSKLGKLSYGFRMRLRCFFHAHPFFLDHRIVERRQILAPLYKLMLMSAAAFNLKKWFKNQLKNMSNALNLKILAMINFVAHYSKKELNLLTLNTGATGV